MLKILFAIALVLPSFQLVPPKSEPKELIVYATGNLRQPLSSISHYFERGNPGWKVKYRFGTSNELSDIVDGRVPVDVFIFGDQENLDSLQQQNLISQEKITPFISDRVVIVVQADSDYVVGQVKDLVTGEDIKKFALSGDKTPLGVLAREYIKKLGLPELPSEKVLNVKNPQAAVAAVKSGDAKWTFCYGTDAAGATKKLKVLFFIPPTDIPPMDYYAVVLKGSKNQAAAQRYMEAVQSTISRLLFQNEGYTLLMAPPPPTQTAPKEKKKKDEN